MRHLAVAALLFVPACVPKPAVGSNRIRGEDGTEQFLVLCRYAEVYCRSEAGRLCATGYDVIERPPKQRDHWSMIVRCRTPGAQPAAAPVEATQPTSSAPRESF